MGVARVLRKENDLHYKVSIIIPCYKVEQYLPRCLDSLVNQTLDGIEAICINDGSPDGSLAILEEYQRKYPNTIVVIDKENEGVWRGRRDAISIARGEYIGFVDSDDYVAEDFCETLYRCCIDNDADISVCGFYRVDIDTGDILSEEMTDARKTVFVNQDASGLLQLNGAPWNKLFKAELLKDMRDFQTPPKIFDDLIMHLLVYPKVKTVAFASKPLVFYIIRGDSIMTTIDKSKIVSTYRAMLETKEYYRSIDASESMMKFLDAAAFLHLGVSLMFRVSYDSSAKMSVVLKENRKFLNDQFPDWKSNDVVSLRKALSGKGFPRKAFLARLVYKSHMMPLALLLYRRMIAGGTDIKW